MFSINQSSYNRLYVLFFFLSGAIPVRVMAQSENPKDTTGQNKALQMVSEIKTHIDPEFVYEYEQSKYVPEAGKTLLIMGQSTEAINEYLEAFPNEALPGGWSSYWGVTEFKGVKEAFKNDTGSSQDHQMLVDEFPNAVIHSAMWMVGQWDIAKNTGYGFYDKVIHKFAKWAKSIDRPIYLRIGYEFDGAHNQLDPREYVAAYQHVVGQLRSKDVDNIAFVWHSYAAPPFQGHDISDWYPGDDYVDWVAISVFGQAYGGEDFGTDTDKVLAFAKTHHKPVMIAESNPIHGIDKETASAWDQWFIPYFNFIYEKNIKAISFINEDWQRLNIPGISEWKDGRLYNNSIISKAWFEEVNKEKYLKASPTLFNELGFE